MKNLISAAVNRPVTVIMAAGALVLAALFSAFNLPLDKLPEIETARLTVETAYPGLGAEDIRASLTIPVEDALSPVKGLRRMQSVSRDGVSLVTLDFRWGTDVRRAAVLVREAIDGVYPSLPAGAEKPLVRGDSGGAQAHIIVAVAAKNGDAAFERDFAEYEMRARLRRIDGVGAVVLSGGARREIKVEVDVQRARAMNLAVSDVAAMVRSETADIPAGNAKEGGQEIIIVSSGKPKSVREISRLYFSGGGVPFALGDLASVRMGTAKPKSVWAWNGKNATALEVWRQAGARPVKLSAAVREAAAEAARTFGRDLDVQIVYDSAPDIIESLRNLLVACGLGAAAVFALLYFFMRSVKMSALAALAIPLSAACALVALKAAGKSLNSMSLSGIALGVGLVSDTAVVILDALRRAAAPRGVLQPMRVVEAAAGLSASSFGGTATTVIVFVPVLFLPGLLGALFGDLAISLIASVTAGWLYAQLALPSLFLLCAPAGGRSVPFPALEAVYARALERVMRRPRRAALVAAAVSLAGGALLAGRPFVFRAEAAARELVARVEYPAGTELAFIGREAARLGAALNGLACVQSVFGRAGAEEEDAARRADAAYTPETLTLRCVLKKSARGEDAAGAVRECLAREAEGAPVVSVDIPEDAVQTMLGLSAARRLVVKAGEPDVAAARAAAWCDSLREEAAGFFQAAVRVPAGGRQALRLVPRREAAAQAGLSAARIAEAAASVTEGFVASEMTIEGRPVDIRLLGAPPETPARAPAAAIEAIPVSGGAQAVSLGTVARLERCETPRVLPRQDRSDVVYIIPYAARGGEKKLNAVINKMTQKTRYVRGEDESFFKRYGVSLLVTLALVLALLYMVMGAQFESFALPLIFMLTIPFSLAGTGPALFLAGKPVDSGAILALVVLFGLVVNNGIVLYETSERHRSGGLAPDEAVKKGARERFRAVLTTTLTTVVVLLPLAFSPLARAEGAMALAMLGGCLAGTALTVFALPPVFARYFARVRSPA